MFGVEGLHDLYRHMEWADSRVWSAIAHSADASRDPELRDRLYHLHLTQRSFLQLWTRQKFDRYDPGRFPTPSEIQPWVRDYYRELPNFLAALEGTNLDEMIAVPWARLFEKQLGRPAASVTLGETLFQVTAHSNYHRGQINTRLKQLGVDPPMVDYIAWLWNGRPGTEWP